jgi:hypothetical protein
VNLRTPHIRRTPCLSSRPRTSDSCRRALEPRRDPAPGTSTHSVR